MSNLLTDILENIGQDTITKVGQNAGLSQETTKTLSEDAMKVLLGGLAKNTNSSQQEAEKVLSVLKNDHLKNLENKGEILAGGMDKEGNGILDHILLDKKDAVLEKLGKENGTDKESAKSFMEVLAPLFMGGLAKTTEKTNMDSDVLKKVLDMAAKSDAAKSKKTASFLSILDLDKDGDIVDDLPKIWAGAMVVWKFVSGFIKKK